MTEPDPVRLDSLEPEDLDGHTIDELADYLDAGMLPADPSIDESAACQNALAAIVRLRQSSLGSLEAAAANEAPADDAPDRVAEARSREEAVETALAELPEAQRRCWLMKEVLEYSYEEMAEELDLPASTVRGLLSRARKNMIRLME